MIETSCIHKQCLMPNDFPRLMSLAEEYNDVILLVTGRNSHTQGFNGFIIHSDSDKYPVGNTYTSRKHELRNWFGSVTLEEPLLESEVD